MTNIKSTVQGNKLILEIDLGQTFGASKSGKSLTIASTEGNKELAPGIKVGLNVYRPVGGATVAA